MREVTPYEKGNENHNKYVPVIGPLVASDLITSYATKKNRMTTPI